jgi:tRNA dimethylallyltransferase
MRALEIILSTGRSITSFQSGNKKKRKFNVIKLGLELPREELYARINKRADQMIGLGLVDEVKDLVPFKGLNSLQTVGYRELFDYFDGAVTLEKAIGLIKQNSRNYAKRQMTWFKKEKDMVWMNAAEEEVLSKLTALLNSE